MLFKNFIELKRGFDLPTQNRKSGKYPIVSSNGINDYHSDYKCVAPGVVTGRSGTIGKVFYLRDNYWPLNTTLYVVDFKKNIPKYVYYALCRFNFIDYATGTSVPTLNRNFLDDVEMRAHSLSEQQHIVDTIGSVDDLIEKYEEIIRKNLNFIRTKFDIMCTQNTTKTLLKDMCKKAICGTTPSTKNPKLWNGKIPFITTTDMANSTFIFSTERYVAETDKITNRLIDSSSISVSCIGTIGVIGMATEKSLTNQQINTVIPFDNQIFYLYNLLIKNTERIKSMATGSATPNISKEEFLKLELDKCDDKNIYKFNSIASNIYKNIKRLEKKIILLKKEKEILLKKYFG